MKIYTRLFSLLLLITPSFSIAAVAGNIPLVETVKVYGTIADIEITTQGPDVLVPDPAAPANLIIIRSRTRQDWPVVVRYAVAQVSELNVTPPPIAVNISRNRQYFSRYAGPNPTNPLIALPVREPLELLNGFPYIAGAAPPDATYNVIDGAGQVISPILDPTTLTGVGETTFSVNSPPEPANGLVARVLASRVVEVWPKPTGTVSIGDNTNFRFTTIAPPLTIQMNNRYPGSIGFSLLYRGNRRSVAQSITNLPPNPIPIQGMPINGLLFNISYGVAPDIRPANIENALAAPIAPGGSWYNDIVNSNPNPLGFWTVELFSLTPVDLGVNFTPARLITEPANVAGYFGFVNLVTPNAFGLPRGRYIMESVSYKEFEKFSDTVRVNSGIITN
jgi:hypothetical protein